MFWEGRKEYMSSGFLKVFGRFVFGRRPARLRRFSDLRSTGTCRTQCRCVYVGGGMREPTSIIELWRVPPVRVTGIVRVCCLFLQHHPLAPLRGFVGNFYQRILVHLTRMQTFPGEKRRRTHCYAGHGRRAERVCRSTGNLQCLRLLIRSANFVDSENNTKIDTYVRVYFIDIRRGRVNSV